ncbi:MAG: RNA polymerase sigma-70 factor [Chryseolinea sp.]
MTHELPEEDIINAIREGNTVAFQHVFDSCYESLCGYAFSMLRDAAEAEDIVQSVFMKLWEKRDSLEIRQSVRSYLFRAVYNQCLNHIEHRAVKSRYQAYSQLEAVEASSEPDPFPDELDQKIRVAVDNLPPQCKKIFMMSRYDGLRYPEISSRLNISVNTIQNQICKALRLLRTELKDNAEN